MAPRIRHSFIYNAAYQLLLIITPIVTTPYLSRVLGPRGVGEYSYTASITNYFVLFATLGISTYGVRAVATARHNRQQLTKTFWSAFASQFLVSFVVMAIYFVYWIPDPKGGHRIAFFWFFWILSAALNASWLLFGVEEFKIPTIRSVIVKLVELACIFLFVREYSDLWKYVAIISFGYLASQLLVWPFVRRYVDFHRPSWKEIKVHFKPSLRLFVPVVAISLYTILDKIMLGTMAGMNQAGYFEYSERIAKLPLAVITALGTVMLPRVSKDFASGNREQAMHLLEISFWFMMIGSFAASFGIAAIAPEFVPKFFSGHFEPAIPVMIVLAGVIPLISATNVIGNQYLLPTFQDRLFTLSVILGAAVNIAANLLLIPRYGALGAAYSTLLAEAVVLVAQTIAVRKQLPIKSFFREILPFFLISLAMVALVRWIAQVTRAMWNLSYTGLFLEVAAGALFFLICALLWIFATKNRFFFELIHTRGSHASSSDALSPQEQGE